MNASGPNIRFRAPRRWPSRRGGWASAIAGAGLLLTFSAWLPAAPAEPPVGPEPSAAVVAPDDASRNGNGLRERILRDPFWPVGYTPAPPRTEPSANQQPEDHAQQALARIRSQIDWPDLTLLGISRAGADRHLAVIADIGLVEPGQIVSLRRGPLVYTWRIDAIRSTGLSFTRLHARPYAASGAPGP